MILTEIVVVVCMTAAGGPCVNYVDVAKGVLSISDCDNAIQRIARDHAAAGTVLRRERSSCSLMPISNQNDLAA
jgi:hypothetical protein